MAMRRERRIHIGFCSLPFTSSFVKSVKFVDYKATNTATCCVVLIPLTPVSLTPEV